MVHPDYFDAETQSSRHLLQDCNDGIIRPPYTNVNTPSNSTLDVTTAQIEGYANFPLSQGPGKSHIPKDSIPMGFADIEGKIIHVGGTYETHKDGKIQAMSYINKFAEQDIAVDGCYPNGVYDGYDESGKVMCTCGVHGQYCSDDFLDTHEDLLHSGSYETSGNFSSFYHSGHESDDFEIRQAAGIPISCDDWISQNCEGIPPQLSGGSDPYLSGVGTCWDILGHDCSDTCLTQAGRDNDYCTIPDEGTDEIMEYSCSNIEVTDGGDVTVSTTLPNVATSTIVTGVLGGVFNVSELCPGDSSWNGDGIIQAQDLIVNPSNALLGCCQEGDGGVGN